jgi:hypothetical protein
MLTTEQKMKADKILADLLGCVREACEDEIQELRSDLARLRLLVLQQTSVTLRGERYWPEWVNKYFADWFDEGR